MIDLNNPEMKKTREGFGRGLVDLGQQDERVVVLVGDLTDSTMVSFFAIPIIFSSIFLDQRYLRNIDAATSKSTFTIS